MDSFVLSNQKVYPMGKSIFFTGQPIFTQLLKFIPRSMVAGLSAKHKADRYCKRFMAYDHLVSMLYCSFHRSSSLRELITGLQANSYRLAHLGFRHTPRRSTLSDANRRRPVAFFSELYHQLYKHHFGLPDSRKNNRLFIIDSTTMSLFSSIMQGAGSYKANGKKKGGVKAHVMFDAYEDLPAFVHLSQAKANDLTFLPLINPPQGSTVVMDKAYIKYAQFQQWTQRSIRWVTRIKETTVFEVLDNKALSKASFNAGVTADRILQLGRPSNARQTPLIKAREVGFFDKEKNRCFKFISNDFDCPPEEIAHIYKKRWQIELLFKRLKQNYPLKYFLGDNPNAIQIQIWTALICDLLIKIVQKIVHRQGKKRWAYANLASMIKHHLMTYIDLIDFLKQPERALIHYRPPETIPKQLEFQYGAST